MKFAMGSEPLTSALSEKQQALWDYLYETVREKGYIPPFSVIGEDLGVSSAAITHLIAELKKRRRVVCNKVYGALTLNEAGECAFSGTENFPSGVKPCFFDRCFDDIAVPADHGVFLICTDCFNILGLRAGDVVEAAPFSGERTVPGDLLVVRCKNFFCLKMYVGKMLDRGFSGLLPAVCINSLTGGDRIVGKVIHQYRKM